MTPPSHLVLSRLVYRDLLNDHLNLFLQLQRLLSSAVAYYIFSRWSEPQDGSVEPWVFELVKSDQAEADAYVQRFSKDRGVEFLIVPATTLPEARASLMFKRAPE